MSELNKNKYLDFSGLQTYDGLIKGLIESNRQQLAASISELNAKIGNLDVEGSDDKTLADIVSDIYASIDGILAKQGKLDEKDAEIEAKITEEIAKVVGDSEEMDEGVTLMTLVEIANNLKSISDSVSKNTQDITDVTNRVTAVEEAVEKLGDLGDGNTLGDLVSDITKNTQAIEILTGEGEGSVKKAAADAQAAAEAYADSLAGNYDAAGTAAGLNAAMDTRMTDVEGDVAALKAIDHDKLVADAVAAVVAGAESEFDTLKEVAEWIASDTLGSAALQTSVSKNTDNLETLMGTGVGSVAEAKSAADAAAQSAATNATAITDLEKKVDDDIANLTTHMSEAASALAEVDGRLDALEEITAIDTSDIEGLFAPTQE